MLSDSRLLNNLLKTEKDSQKSFNQWTKDAASASSALSAWAVADSGDTQDLMDASMRITQLLAACADSQRLYLSSISAYRTSLKDVLERETTLRTVVRDREILVGRLIKLGNKKPGDSALDSHQSKLEDAQRELAACETFLQNEEAALGSVKRTIFREALSARMRSMGELGRTMEDSAKEAIELLSQLGQGYDAQGYPRMLEELGSQAGDSITPSHSASQGISRRSSVSSSSGEDEEYLHGSMSIPAPHQFSRNGNSSSIIPTYVAPPPRPTNGASRASTIVGRPRASAPLLSVPVAARGAAPTIPIMEIPKAPARVGSRRPVDDSSDEEDEEAFASMGNGHARASTSQTEQPKRFLRRRAHSDTSTVTERIGRDPAKKSGFFGGLASLFKRAPPRDSSPPSQRQGSIGAKWDTRIDRNVFTAARGAGGGGRRGADDSSDEDGPKRRLIRVVNDPNARVKAMSDVGAASASIKSKKSLAKKKSNIRASSDIGVMTRLPTSTVMSPSASSIAVGSSIVEPRRKIRKRAESITGFPTVGPVVAVPVANPRSTGLSRNNTVTSSFSTATAQTLDPTKPKRKKRISTATVATPLLRSPLTAADLASSLPSARSYNIIHQDVGTTRGDGGVLLGGDELVHGSGKAPSHLRETEKKVAKENKRYGVDGWVSKPSSPVLGSEEGAFKDTDQRESIMTIVDRVGKPEEKQAADDTSRRYGATTLPKLVSQASSSMSDLAGTPRSRDSLQPADAVTLTKRKSVRMAEISNGELEMTRSPAASVRSDSTGAPRHGILINNHSSPSQSNLASGESENSTWNMRSSVSGTFNSVKDDDDSSDEDEGEYALARKKLAKKTKEFDIAGLAEMGGGPTAKEKGKGRASEQY